MGLLVQDAVTPSAWRKIADASLCVAVFATAFFYRFNTISGPLGGFTNDQFGYLARARQIQSGEVPFLDFNDPGWFLTDYLSAAAQWIGGYSLRSEALLTVGLLSIGAVVMFALARRATGSVFAACVAAALLVAIAPRHYNYPKIVLYATALALAWAYIGKPGRARLGALGALIGIAFLFRHDHLIYLGAFGLLTIAFAHRASIQDGLRAALGLGAATAVFVVPFLVFLALSGGIGEYFRLALVYAQREAERTDFSAPLFSRDSSRSFATLTLTRSARINVRWQPVSEEQRRDREARYRLVAGRLVEGTTWTYVLRDVSRANIEPLVRDPLVDDTHGLSRATFTADAPRWLRLETQLDTLPNATAFLYYTFLITPLIAGFVLFRLHRAVGATRVLSTAGHLVPLLVLAGMLNVGLLSRGSTLARVPDVGVTAVLLLVWLAVALVSRDGRVVVPGRPARLLVRTATVVLLCLTALSVNTIGYVTSALPEAGFTRGGIEILNRGATSWKTLGMPPGTVDEPPFLNLAAYVRACTLPTDRLFVLGEHPELYYFSDRRFAGGHAWLLPGYYSADQDEAQIVARLRSARVPVVLRYESFRYDFEQVYAYLEREYQEVGDVEASAGTLGVLVRTDLKPVRRYEPLDFPCFAPPGASGDE